MVFFCGSGLAVRWPEKAVKMAELQLKLDEARGATSNTTNKTGNTTNRRMRERAGRRSGARRSGAALLRCAVDRQVSRNSKTLAKLLTEEALKGDLATTKVLLALAERYQTCDGPAKNRREMSLAINLAKLEKWDEPAKMIFNGESWEAAGPIS